MINLWKWHIDYYKKSLDSKKDNQISMTLTDSNQQEFFKKEGYLIVENLLSVIEVEKYISIYDRFLNGDIDAGDKRSDLGTKGGTEITGKENITQIMWPSALYPEFTSMVYHQEALTIAQQLLGNDIAIDFDMLINKSPHTATQTPWHQDAAYWVDLPDKRAVSCWLALNESTVDNGCMWYVPGSHLEKMRKHKAITEGGALVCEASESEGIAIPLKPGSCVFHAGNTLHYSRGNTTSLNRKAFIINLRPEDMILMEREKGMDHGLTENKRTFRNEGSK